MASDSNGEKAVLSFDWAIPHAMKTMRFVQVHTSSLLQPMQSMFARRPEMAFLLKPEQLAYIDTQAHGRIPIPVV